MESGQFAKQRIRLRTSEERTGRVRSVGDEPMLKHASCKRLAQSDSGKGVALASITEVTTSRRSSPISSPDYRDRSGQVSTASRQGLHERWRYDPSDAGRHWTVLPASSPLTWSSSESSIKTVPPHELRLVPPTPECVPRCINLRCERVLCALWYWREGQLAVPSGSPSEQFFTLARLSTSCRIP